MITVDELEARTAWLEFQQASALRRVSEALSLIRAALQPPSPYELRVTILAALGAAEEACQIESELNRARRVLRAPTREETIA